MAPTLLRSSSSNASVPYVNLNFVIFLTSFLILPRSPVTCSSEVEREFDEKLKRLHPLSFLIPFISDSAHYSPGNWMLTRFWKAWNAQRKRSWRLKMDSWNHNFLKRLSNETDIRLHHFQMHDRKDLVKTAYKSWLLAGCIIGEGGIFFQSLSLSLCSLILFKKQSIHDWYAWLAFVIVLVHWAQWQTQPSLHALKWLSQWIITSSSDTATSPSLESVSQPNHLY